jgi:hypothetical protein
MHRHCNLFAACRKLAGLGVPVLRDLFKQVFGENTASNNAGWLRRKLSENPDSVHGQCRSRVVRARDSGAAIWNRPLIMLGVGEEEDAGFAAAEAEGQGEAGGFSGGFQQPLVVVKQEGDVAMQEAAGVAQVCIFIGRGGFAGTFGCLGWEVGDEEAGDAGFGAAAAAEAEGQGEAGGFAGGYQQPLVVKQEGDVAMQEAAGVAQVCISIGWV